MDRLVLCEPCTRRMATIIGWIENCTVGLWVCVASVILTVVGIIASGSYPRLLYILPVVALPVVLLVLKGVIAFWPRKDDRVRCDSS